MTTPSQASRSLVPELTVQTVSFGERAVVALFKGAGGLLASSGSGASGLDTLNERLQDTFADYALTSQVFESFEGNVSNFREVGSDRGQAFLNQFDAIAGLGLLGYSAGGLSAIRTAKAQSPNPVDLLIQLDTFDPLTGASDEDEILPSNVVQGINYYQNANRFNVFQPDFDAFDLQGAREVDGSINIDAEDFVDDGSITHRNIEDNDDLQDEILQDFEEFVLQDLQFDRANQLALSGAAQRVNNILSLAPNNPAEPGQALIATPFTIGPDTSFETRFEFDLAPALSGAATPPGFSFLIQPQSDESSNTSLAIAFEPTALNAPTLAENAIAVLTPDTSPTPLGQAIAPLDLDSGDPLTAWVDYDGLSDRLSVFLSDTLTQPATPLLSVGLDLPAISGPLVQFGVQTTVGGSERRSQLLTWQLETIGGLDQRSSAIPDTYLNQGLTQQFAAAVLDLDLPATPFEVGELEFSTLFDEAFYLRLNPDVLAAVVQGDYASGYDHFTQFGWLEGRGPSSLFDATFYATTNPDVAQAVAAGAFSSGFEHFARYGHIEGRNPSSLFDQADYLLTHPDVADAASQGGVLSAFDHYVEAGAAEGRSPGLLLFQEGYYLAQNPDVAAAVAADVFTNGFDHYLSFGCREGRQPTAFFNEAQYLDLHPDVAAAVSSGDVLCGWAHFALSGRFEGRAI